MSGDLIKLDQGELVSYIHNGNGKLDLPELFKEDVFLFDTYISGINEFADSVGGHALPERGERLNLFREQGNKYDENAVVIKNQRGEIMGYIPRQSNAVFAKLMDAGKELFCKVSAVEHRGELLKVRIKIYMND